MARYEYRDITAELSGTFPNGWHTPAWRQVRMLSDHPIGCGPTAWGIVYGYWSAFNGKGNLFDGYDVASIYDSTPPRSSSVAEAMGKISNDTDTNYGGEVMNQRFGLTWPRNMCKGIKYAKSKGYSNAKCTRYRGTEISKCKAIQKYINADKPVILLIKSDGRGIPNHYVVIEKAVLRQRRRKTRRGNRKWRDRDVYYVANFGHGPSGSGKKEIWVREKGVNRHKIWTAGSAFLISM